MPNKIYFLSRKKFMSGILIAIIFSLSFGTVLAQTGTLIVPPAAIPSGIPSAPAYPVSDTATQFNTNAIVINTYSIASSLSGLAPGAQNDKARSGILMIVIKRVLRQITESIVSWINGGMSGSPSFITDPQQWLKDTADITIGDMLLNDPALNFLCDPFKIRVKLALGLQYRPFKNVIACSFTSALGNVNDAMAMNNFMNGDFINGGGWNSWLQITTEPQNNQMGAMILTQGELDARLEASTHQAELEAGWGGGFMSWKKCTNTVTHETSYGFNTGTRTFTTAGTTTTALRSLGTTGDVSANQIQCTIQTPGTAIVDQLSWFNTSDLRQSELANDLNEIVNALANQLITQGVRLLTAGTNGSVTGLMGVSNQTQYSNAQAELDQYTSSLQAALNNPTPSTPNNGYYNNNGGINFSQTFVNRSVALQTIQSQIGIETQYLTAQSNILQMLTATQNAFASSACASSAYIINQITGNFTGVKDLPWNKADIALATSTATQNLSTLSTVATAVQSATDDSTVPSLVQPLTTMTTLQSAAAVSSYSPGGTFYNPIRNWLVNEINANSSCLGTTAAQLGIQ